MKYTARSTKAREQEDRERWDKEQLQARKEVCSRAIMSEHE